MGTSDRPTVVILSSVHDYRMARRGSIQAVADAFVRAGFRTILLSIRFSALSLLKRDPRSFLVNRANRLETVNGVECYLWGTPLHPFKTGSPLGDKLTEPLHDAFAAWPNPTVDRLLAAADVVLVESGLSVLLIPRIRRVNPSATLIYRGSDPLDVIGAHPLLQRRLESYDPLIDWYCLLASGMAPQFVFSRHKTFVVPQAISPDDYLDIGPSPYARGSRNAVSVGSMLFDPGFFDIAAPAFPNVTFHVIGCGAKHGFIENVKVYDEAPFRETLPFIKHASVGIAPYRNAPAASYLAESSMKLTQFAYLRRPAVCPHFATGGRAHRFGYTPGDAAEIEYALRGAMSAAFNEDIAAPMSWDDAVPRFLRPHDFPDARIPDAMFDAGSAVRHIATEPRAATDLQDAEARRAQG
jgi:2-beta-glucuronyltransferase